MNSPDMQNFLKFILRPGMYILGGTKNEIIAFVHGYLTAQGKECRIMENLELYIEEEYGIKGHASRWTGQIYEYSAKTGYNRETAFSRLMLEMIIRNMDKSIEKETGNQLKSAAENTAIRLPEAEGIKNKRNRAAFYAGWIERCESLVLTGSSWYKSIWTEKKWELLLETDRQLKNLRSMKRPCLSDSLKNTIKLFGEPDE